jgi:hypothetical protein
MRYRRRRAAPIPYWIAGCEFEPQGLLEVWISRRGRPALVCDECGLGDTLDPPHARLASRADLEALGGWRLVPSASRAQHGEQG